MPPRGPPQPWACPQGPIYTHTPPNTVTLDGAPNGLPALHLDSWWLPHAQSRATGKTHAYPTAHTSRRLFRV